ncbi:MAG: hypothetical protein WA154_00240 [Moraxellaceae bacterium]
MSQENPVIDQKAFLESENVKFVGHIVIWISIIAAAICCFKFGTMQIESDSIYGRSMGYYEDATNWAAIIAFIASGLSGVLLGYLFLKVGSVLRHLEEAKLKK